MLQPKDILAEWIQKGRPLYKMYIRHPPQTQGHRQTESEELEKDTPHKWKSKESESSNTHIR